MKKKWLTGHPYGDSLKKLMRIMRLTILLLFGCMLTVSANSYAQRTKLDINMTNITIRDLVSYVEERLLAYPVGFTLKNLGQSTIHNIKLVLTFEHNENLMILMEDDFSSRPRKYFNFLEPTSISNDFLNASTRSNTSLDVYNQKHVLSVEFGNIQPKFSAWSDEPLFIGYRKDGKMIVKAYVFADELSEPLSVDLTFDFKTEKLDLSLMDLEKRLNQEYKKLYKELDD